MVQTLMVRTLEDTNPAFRYVGRTPPGGAGDIAVLTEITDFQAEAVAPDHTVTIRVRMVTFSCAKAMCGSSPNGPSPPPHNRRQRRIEDLARSFNSASDQTMRAFAVWAASALGEAWLAAPARCLRHPAARSR